MAWRNDRCDKHQDKPEAPKLCHVCQRIAVEHDICTRMVDALLASGFSLNVNNGGQDDELMQASRNRSAILAAMFATDVEHLRVYKDTGARMIAVGWILFVYGNDGWDVISDYTTNLDAVLQPVNEYADTLA